MAYERGRKFERKEGESALFNNRNRKSDKSPDMTGQVTIGGRDYWVSGWWKTPKDDRAPDYLSIAITPKEESRGRREYSTQRGERPRMADRNGYEPRTESRPSRPQRSDERYDERNPPPPERYEGPDDDIPF